MRSPDCARSHIAASAALAAVVEARLRSSDGASLQYLSGAPHLLRAHAAEMAVSPIGRDQVLSLALTRAAEDLEQGRSPDAADLNLFFEGAEVTAEARLEVRRRVFQQGALPVAESRRVVEVLERRFLPECATLRALSRRLTEEARLHERLWDDPRLACDGRTRLIMLASVSKLLERADELDARRLAVPGVKR
jgi:hypothetical protein